MNIAIIGYGEQGRSAYDYWSKQGHSITLCDRNLNLKTPEGVSTQLGEHYLDNLEHFDLLVRSPAVHPRELIQASSQAILTKVTSVTNEFFRVSPTKKIIGVTGTKGKGTTSTLITKMLQASGFTVHLGGNIGTPPLDLLNHHIEPTDWVVLELANFQLIDIKYSPVTAVCLMVVPEHLDWHHDLAEYISAKQQLFRYQIPDNTAIYFADNQLSQQVVSISKGKKIPYFASPGAYVEGDQIMIENQKICSVKELKLLGRHNWQNVCAAITAVWLVTQDIQALKSVLTSFSGLEHRLQFVRELKGVSYYDDSFGTTPDTAIVAIEAFGSPKVIILGGSDKKSDYTKLAHTIAGSNIRSCVLIGKMGPVIEKALQSAGYHQTVNGGDTMLDIVASAQKVAQPGDVVLLSTACASFDMFNNYKDRGEQFTKAVQALV